MSTTTHSNNDHTIAQIPNANIAEIAPTKQNVIIFMAKVMLSLIIIIVTLLIIDNQTTRPNQRHLDTEEAADSITLSFARVHEVPSSANLNDVYDQIESEWGYPVTLVYHGRVLPNDEEISLDDAKIREQSIIHVVPSIRPDRSGSMDGNDELFELKEILGQDNFAKVAHAIGGLQMKMNFWRHEVRKTTNKMDDMRTNWTRLSKEKILKDMQIAQQIDAVIQDLRYLIHRNSIFKDASFEGLRLKYAELVSGIEAVVNEDLQDAVNSMRKNMM